MKAIKILLLTTGILLSLIGLTGCEIDRTDDKEYPFFMYFARNANFFWADNIRGETISALGHTSIFMTPLKNDSVVKAAEYILEFNTCNKDITDIPASGFPNYFSSDRYDPLNHAPYLALNRLSDPMTDDSDPNIEEIINRYLCKTYRDGMVNPFPASTRANLVRIDYRLTPITNLIITASKDIFGVKVGNNLNDCFIIHGYPQYLNFIVTADKRLVTGLDKVTDISIAKYLSYRPLAPAAMYLKLKKGITVPANITTEFTIEFEIEGNRTVKATTRPVTITP